MDSEQTERLVDSEQCERLLDSEQSLPNKEWHTFIDDERDQLQSDAGQYIYLNAGFRLKSSCIPPVDTVPRGGQIKML